ncbi:hypothetical protein Nepgr_013534 [Nepenthes gracilis]|uniref:Uncharacterized protein n=1 Tax=Nepenthes gracilis TaxID=150966 RepID=A0AAD3SI55_NEPGR|nr:hypothetical protein Nepgr_013534 [Nepenthes gracilis]
MRFVALGLVPRGGLLFVLSRFWLLGALLVFLTPLAALFFVGLNFFRVVLSLLWRCYGLCPGPCSADADSYWTMWNLSSGGSWFRAASTGLPCPALVAFLLMLPCRIYPFEIGVAVDY